MFASQFNHNNTDELHILMDTLISAAAFPVKMVSKPSYLKGILFCFQSAFTKKNCLCESEIELIGTLVYRVWV